MAMFFGDLNTRARGLRTHLLKPVDWDRLAQCSGLVALQRELNALGLAPGSEPATPQALERAVRLHAASQIAVLARWSDRPRREALAVLFEDEDRRSVQAIVRGAEQGVPSDTRLSGLVPTNTLSERALHALATQPTSKGVVRMLARWRHPLAPRLVEAIGTPHPSLLDIELALHRAFAERASKQAKAGGPLLRQYVAQLIDVTNAFSALLHFNEGSTKLAGQLYVPGGEILGPDQLARLLSCQRLSDVENELAALFHRAPLGMAFQESRGDLSRLDLAVLQAQIAWQGRAARIDPECPAPTIGFTAELRQQVFGLQKVIWGVALRAPPALRIDGVVAA